MVYNAESCAYSHRAFDFIAPYCAVVEINTGRWALKHNAELGLGVPNSGTFWMREYWDRYIRDTQHLKSVVEYILNNPVKARICHTPENFKFSGINKKNVTQYTEEETRT